MYLIDTLLPVHYVTYLKDVYNVHKYNMVILFAVAVSRSRGVSV